jgi:hypothetical protein
MARFHRNPDGSITLRTEVEVTVPAGTSMLEAEERLMVEVNKAAFKAVCDPVNAKRLNNPDVARLYAAIKAMV